MPEIIVHEISGAAVINEASAISAAILEKINGASKGDTIVLKIDKLTAMDSSFIQIVVAAMQETKVHGVSLLLEGKKACELCAVVECEFGGTTCIDGLFPEKEMP